MLTKCYVQVVRKGDPQVEIDLSQKLYQRLVEEAQYNGRDVKAEITARLTQMMHYQRRQWVAEQTASEIVSRLRMSSVKLT